MTTVTEILGMDRTSFIERADSDEGPSKMLDVMAEVASEHPETSKTDPGFFDMALFYARKHASCESEPIRDSVVSLLLGIGTIDYEWGKAVVETLEEIEMQPSPHSADVASKARRALKDKTPVEARRRRSE